VSIKGPAGGLFRDLEASSTDGNVFYAAYGRSFYRSTDGGATWIEHPFTGFVNDIAVDPADGNRVLVAAQLDGLFRSLDGGRTFTERDCAMGQWCCRSPGCSAPGCRPCDRR
jgi:hypothetical protein